LLLFSQKPIANLCGSVDCSRSIERNDGKAPIECRRRRNGEALGTLAEAVHILFPRSRNAVRSELEQCRTGGGGSRSPSGSRISDTFQLSVDDVSEIRLVKANHRTGYVQKLEGKASKIV
jgi:hypothetical protein